jgi:mevalonate kinase
MNELAEAIKRWNEVERKRVMERLQPWADGRIAKGKTSGGGGGGCWGWLKGEGYKVSSRGLIRGFRADC